MTSVPMHPVRFWLLFLALATTAILFAGSSSAASTAGKVSRSKVSHRVAKQSPKKTINKPIVKKPIVKIGTAYVTEMRHE